MLCGRAFAQKSNATKHVRTHRVWPRAVSRTPGLNTSSAAAARGYDCAFCAESRQSYVEFRRHLKEKHEDEKASLVNLQGPFLDYPFHG